MRTAKASVLANFFVYKFPPVSKKCILQQAMLKHLIYKESSGGNFLDKSPLCCLWLLARCIASTTQSSQEKVSYCYHILTILLPYYIYIATIIAILSAYYKKSPTILPSYYSHIMPILCTYWTTAPILRLLFCPNDKSHLKWKTLTTQKHYKQSLILFYYVCNFLCI